MLKTKADRAVLQKLYQENAKKLYFIAWRIVQNEAEAEEVVKICFQKLAEDFARYRNQNYKNLERLSFMITRNVAKEIAAKQVGRVNANKSVRQSAGQTASTASGECKVQTGENAITQAVRELEEDERNFLYMQYGLELGLKEIGGLMDMTPEEAKEKILSSSNKLLTVLEAKTV